MGSSERTQRTYGYVSVFITACMSLLLGIFLNIVYISCRCSFSETLAIYLPKMNWWCHATNTPAHIGRTPACFQCRSSSIWTSLAEHVIRLLNPTVLYVCYRLDCTLLGTTYRCIAIVPGLVIARSPAAREVPGSNRAADIKFVFNTENHCDMQLLARATHWLHCL